MAVQQRALTVIASVNPGALDGLQKLLTEMAADPDAYGLRLRDSPSTHFARFVLINYGGANRLLFTSNYDGDEASYLTELAKACGQAMDTIWAHCSTYKPGDALDETRWAGFVKQHAHPENTFFVSLPGLTTQGILRSAQIRAAIERLLDEVDPSVLNVLNDTLQIHGQGPQPTSGKKSEWLNRLMEWAVGIDNSMVNPNTVLQNQMSVSRFEDQTLHNALTIVAPLKSSLWSHFVIRAVLGVGRYAVKGAWGSLSGVTSIHFARWIIIDSNTLLFESNFDGSWESYIDSFVDVSSAGLNGIWGNCVGYPKRGCRDIESFKEVIRKHQHPALIFYSAYPDLTVKNIIANHTIATAFNAFVNTGNTTQILAGSYERGT
jgi:hypothetical protein